MKSKLNKALDNFLRINERIAKKYKAKISMEYKGKEVLIADQREYEKTK